MATDRVKYWTEIADYDLGTAETLYEGGRWLYVAFMCHQAIEKTLKAYWCSTQPNDPPFTHNLTTGMDKEQALELVRQYKQVIAPHFSDGAKVFLFGSYSKGYARPESDIDVAVVVPSFGDNWWTWTKSLWRDVRKVSSLIEPILMEEGSHSPLYDDVMRTGIAV